ncbi:MAG: hypothetical protein KC425_13880, partial [Anaerolineales bacterium]|nr:hypothetical protein [Anaerolineales bacterium]
YSHTPFGSGARQPGMTGQVKEEILTRWGELGVSLHAGALRFAPALLSAAEFAPEAASFTCVDLGGETRAVPLPPDSLAFTVCQTPVVYTLGDTPQVEVIDQDGRVIITPGCQLDLTTTRHVLNRDGHVRLIRVQVRPPGAADVESGP